MNVAAADVASAGPPWLTVGIAVLGLVGVYVTARAPVWLERAKARFGKPKESASTPAEKAATGEAILREWLADTIQERDRAQAEVKRLTKRIEALKAELYQRGWDGRMA